jgi:predicted DCC family thiol-disulfide oxidoreductase YuxK
MRVDDPVVLFDGECNLCSHSVNFLLRHDRAEILRFASLQSEVARRLVGDRLGDRPIDADTIVLVVGERLYMRSDAVLRVAGLLPWPWRVAKVLLVVPRPLRDAAYRVVARYRKQVFRKKVVCRLPTADERRRLL